MRMAQDGCEDKTRARLSCSNSTMHELPCIVLSLSLSGGSEGDDMRAVRARVGAAYTCAGAHMAHKWYSGCLTCLDMGGNKQDWAGKCMSNGRECE